MTNGTPQSLWGFTRQRGSPKRAHLRFTTFKNTTEIPPRERINNESCGWSGKRERNSGGPGEVGSEGGGLGEGGNKKKKRAQRGTPRDGSKNICSFRNVTRKREALWPQKKQKKRERKKDKEKKMKKTKQNTQRIVFGFVPGAVFFLSQMRFFILSRSCFFCRFVCFFLSRLLFFFCPVCLFLFCPVCLFFILPDIGFLGAVCVFFGPDGRSHLWSRLRFYCPTSRQDHDSQTKSSSRRERQRGRHGCAQKVTKRPIKARGDSRRKP